MSHDRPDPPPRGRVGLIFAGIGAGLMLAGRPVLLQAALSAIVPIVLVTTLLAVAGGRSALQEKGGSPG